MLNLGNAAYATTESSQHCFLGAQMGKHLSREQNVFEKKNRDFVFLGNKKKMFPQQILFRVRANVETFSETCFATMFPRLRRP